MKALNGVVKSDAPGMAYGFDEKPECRTCFCPHCSDYCHATVGTVYVLGFGYRTLEFARTTSNFVRWEKTGWLAPALDAVALRSA